MPDLIVGSYSSIGGDYRYEGTEFNYSSVWVRPDRHGPLAEPMRIIAGLHGTCGGMYFMAVTKLLHSE